MKEINIDIDELTFLFEEGNYSIKELSKKYNCSKSTIRYKLKKNNVKTKKDYGITKNKLIKLYKEKKMTPKEMSSIFNCSVPVIRYYIKKYSITPNTYYDYNKPNHGDKYSRWTFLEEVKIKSNKKIWKCECECGTIKELDYITVKNGISKSCGCYHADRMREINWNGFEKISGRYWSSLIRGANSRKIEFNIDIAYAWEVYRKQNGICAISGIKIFFPKNTKDKVESLKSASLDRIDSSKGYVKDNIQWVSKTINYMKGNMSDLEFIEICKLIYKNNNYDK